MIATRFVVSLGWLFLAIVPRGAVGSQTLAPQGPPLKSSTHSETHRSTSTHALYGFIRFDAIYDDSRMDNHQSPTWVLSEDAAENPTNDNHLTLHPRLTRFGWKLPRKTLEADAWISGRIEIDFQNGGKESRAGLRMRHAYMNLNLGHFTLLLGQSWDVISPLYPAVNADSLMWNCGNLGDRRPQARMTFRQNRKGEGVNLALSTGMTGAVDGQDLDHDGEIDGLSSAQPTLQVRLAYNLERMRVGQKATAGAMSSPAELQYALGVWGHWAKESLEEAQIAGKRNFRSVAIGADFHAPVLPYLSLMAEVWMGHNLSDVRGGIGQGVNPTTGQGVRARGGWFQFKVYIQKRWTLFLGGSMDDPDDGHVGPGGRTRNLAHFGAVSHKPWPKFRWALQYFHWQTDYLGLKHGIDNRLNGVAQYFF